LTRIDTAPIETIIDADSDEMFDHPWLLAISAAIGCCHLRKPTAFASISIAEDF
jgi:hypothetical protein